MSDQAEIAAIDWDSVAVGDPDPSAGLTEYPQCGWEITAGSGEYDGGTFWCTRGTHHVGRCVATDDVQVLAVGPGAAS